MNRLLQLLISTQWAIDPDLLAAVMKAAQGAPEELQAAGSGIDDKEAGKVRAEAGAVAIIPVHGILTARKNRFMELFGFGTSMETIGGWLSEAVADTGVKSIILDINSPGGQVAGTPEMAAQILAAGEIKPIIAQVNHTASSAAYWLASQAGDIAVSPSGEAGSIGVVAVYHSLSPEEQEQTEIISAGRFKGEARGQPLDDSARTAIQHRIDQMYDSFVADVAAGRGTTPEAVRGGYGEGRTLSAPDALAAGLVDRVATMPETIDRFMAGRQESQRNNRQRRHEARARSLDVAARRV